MKDKSIDILGIKPIAKSIETVTQGMVDGASAFLSRVCLPASEEFGLLLKDQVRSWRNANATLLANKAEAMVEKYHGDSDVTIHPRIAHAVLDQGSWSDDDTVQNMWAGLLASGCDVGGGDDSNIVFTTILSQLTGAEVRIVRHAVEHAKKYVFKSGWPYAESIELDLDTLRQVAGTDDEHRLDREMDHIRSLDLIGGNVLLGGGGGFSSDCDTTAILRPTALAFHLYVRGEGFPGSPTEFFSLSVKPEPPSDDGAQSTADG